MSQESSSDVPELLIVSADPDGEGPVQSDHGSQMVEEPAKVMRIGTMIKQLLEEVRQAPLDETSRVRLREIYETSVREIAGGISPDLRDELNRLVSPFATEETPSDAVLRIAHAQLVGWLEGLFHGIQATLFAQQMSTRAQLQELRGGALPSGDSDKKGDDTESRHSPYL